MNDTADPFADEDLCPRIFDAVPDLIFVVDNECRIVRVNRAAAQRLGCTAEQLVGRRCDEVIHGTDAPPASCPHRGVLQGGTSQPVEFHQQWLGGDFAITVTPLADGHGRTVGAVHVARDITQLTRIVTELRGMRDRLEQRYALAVAAMLDGLWERDYATDHVLYSDRYLEMLGYRREEAPPTADFVYGIMHPDDAPAVQAAVKRHLTTRGPLEVEFRLRTKTGAYRWFVGRGQAEWDAAGRATRLAGTIQDITERKRAEEAREERIRFESLLADISARFVGVSNDRVPAEVAAALAQVREFFGFDRVALRTFGGDSAVLAHPSFSVRAEGLEPIDPNLDSRVMFPWGHAQVQSGEPLIVVRDQLPPEADAERLAMERYGIQTAAVIPILVGGCPRYVLTATVANHAQERYVDLLPRLRVLGQIFVQTVSRGRAEQALHEAELKYRTLADFSSDWEYWQDTSGNFRYMSPSCEKITGYPPQEFLDNPALLQDIVVPEDAPRVAEHRRDCIDCRDRREGCRLEFRIRRRDGQVTWLGHVCRPVVDAQGRLLGMRASNRDMTEQKANEAQLQAALAEIGRLKERLEKENLYLQDEIKTVHDFGEIVGQSAPLRTTLHKVELVSATEATVLLMGETGTGKELIARAIHGRSRRRERPLVKVNCAALPSTLIESELFGHVQGAFTGALADKTGRFELADGGTLFLDEIGELDPDLQTKLLRVLQDGEFERIGSSHTIRADVRVIAATNRDLHRAIGDGSFRPDLYYRLSVFPIEVPPLRTRREDIPLLVWHFITHKQRALGKTIQDIPHEVMDALLQYDWPGNVRELANVIERAMILSPGRTLKLSESLTPGRRHAKPEHHAPRTRADVPVPSAGSLAEVDRAHIVAVLDECGWRVKGAGNAAERLGLKASTLRFRMKKLGIERRPGKPR